MLDSIKSAQLLVKISSDKLYPKLIEQLNKDFRLAGIFEELPLTIKPKQLHAHLSEVICQIMTHHFSDYLNLLYRVDISEVQIKKLKGLDVEQMSNQVALLILQRECQKVLIRNRS